MTASRFRRVVRAEVAFDYLADPRNRAEWQSVAGAASRTSTASRGSARPGSTSPRPGLRPRMETTELDRPRRWTERGTWRGIARRR